ncbi:MAG: DUF385 domain-containing protein [Actinobacteria bacterium]|nr:DUF385 domain-containing protein [Actinomycetota bacterium]MSW41400.1 DUF385 domain-containing protein [Actinomycetota bacterium]
MPTSAPARTRLRASSSWVFIGSNAGQAKVSGWVFNARANPEGFVEVDGQHFRAQFVKATDGDRDELYARLVSIWKAYALYEQNAERYIPVFRAIVAEAVLASALPSMG